MTASVSATQVMWSSRLTFLLASIGASVGLGNIWRFPFVAGSSGGGAFVLLYILCILLVAIPAFIASTIIAKRGRGGPSTCFANVAVSSGRSNKWRYVGLLSLLAAFLVLSYFSVVAGWVATYSVMSVTGVVHNLDGGGAVDLFSGLMANPLEMSFYHGVIILINVFLVALGVKRGLERSVNLMMPMLFILMLVLLVCAMIYGDFSGALQFLFAPDFSKIDGEIILVAMGQALFSLGVGGAGVFIYGVYLPEGISIPKASVQIAIADTVVALVAGLIIFPMVFANGLEPASGPNLIFITLPTVFSQIPVGELLAPLFFFLIFLAGITTTISMLEPLVAWMQEHFKSRAKITLTIGALTWVTGLVTVFSFNIWKDVRLLYFIDMVSDKNLFELLDFFVANLFMPLVVLLTVIFVGWVMPKNDLRAEFSEKSQGLYQVWYLIVKYFLPVSLIGIAWVSFL